MLLIPLLLGTFIASAQLFFFARDRIEDRQWQRTVSTIREELQIDHVVSRLLPYFPKQPASTLENSPHTTGTQTFDDENRSPVETDNRQAPRQPEPTVHSRRDQEAGEKEAPPANGKRHTATRNDTAIDEPATFDDDAQSLSEEEIVERQRRQVDQLQAELERSLKQVLLSIAQRTFGAAGVAAPGAAANILGILTSGIIGSLMFVIALYYFLADGPALLAASERLVPVHVDYQRQLRTRFELVVRAVVLATFLAALIQGLLTALAVSFAGFGLFFVFLFVAALVSLIPLAGTWLVWGPCAIWLAHEGHWGAAILLALFGAIVIGTMDNVIRTYVLQSDAKLHTLLAFVSVLGGVQVMGLWGVFIGPIVASCLHALVQIFNSELKEFSKAKFGTLENETAPEPAAQQTPEASKSTSKQPERRKAAGKKLADDDAKASTKNSAKTGKGGGTSKKRRKR